MVMTGAEEFEPSRTVLERLALWLKYVKTIVEYGFLAIIQDISKVPP